jgi:two-component system sensor histidine kinase PilS (NtrC family)
VKEFDQSFLEEQQKAQRATIFRVYNYYRILISFLFLFLFLDSNLNEFVGHVNPDLFRLTIISYITLNIVIGIATLFVSTTLLSRTGPALVVLIGDIIFLTLLMSASGGVSSGLGNFLFFTLAFAGGLIHGRVSTVLPAIAFILTLYDEFYLFFLDENDIRSFFQAGLLGIVYFVTNILFQTLSKQLRSGQTEVYTLEQINQLIIEGMRTGVVVITDDNKPKMMNRAAEMFLSRPEAPVTSNGQLPAKFLEVVDQWKQGFVKGEVRFTVDNEGEELVATLSELHTPSTKADTLIFIEDSTEVQRQAQQLKLASLGRLSASIAHEIRNPLGAISHAAQLLSESTNLDKGDERLCEIVQDHSVRMNDVIENVLQMSRRQAPEKIEIELQEWLDRFVDEFSMGAEATDIEVVLSPGSTRVSVDPLHLSQILANLCQNGLRYSDRNTGEAKILITGGKEPLTNRPFVEVNDFGTGVSKDNIEKLFEPFYTTESKGTGLGLYLSRELCDANDARLTYRKSETGGGAFRVTFAPV